MGVAVVREYIVKILSWKKYQNREVKTRSIWFRLQNDFIDSPNFSEFTSDERVVWLHALCCASKLNTDSLQVPDQCSHRVLNRCTGIDEKTFHRTFEKLKKLRIVEIRTTRGRYADDTREIANDTLQDKTGHDGDETRQDKTNTLAHSRSEFDFESLYQKYPLKKGRSEGLERCRAQIKTQADFDGLSIAIDRYRRDLLARGTEPKFIQHFSTFMGSKGKQPWKDWLDPAAGKVTLNAPAPISKIASEPPASPEERVDPAKIREIVSNTFKPIRGAQ